MKQIAWMMLQRVGLGRGSVKDRESIGYALRSAACRRRRGDAAAGASRLVIGLLYLGRFIRCP